jgi:hypothetical protein
VFKKLVRTMTKLNRDERGIFEPETINIFVALIVVVGIAIFVFSITNS